MSSSNKDAIGFGIVGSGMIAAFHAQAINGTPGARIVGVSSRTASGASALAEKHGAVFSTDRLAGLINHPEIQVVCVTTPSGAHMEPALAAIGAGRHVIVEKPMEVTTARCDGIIEAAESAGVLLAPIFQARFGAGARRVKAAVSAGRLGRLVLASAYVKWHRAASYYTGWKGIIALDGGAAVINQAIHGIDLLQWFAGMPEEVFAFKTRRVHTGIEGEDTACAALRYPGGALGTIEATTAAWPGWSRRIELCGEKGSIAIEDDRITRWDFLEPLPDDETIRAAGREDTLGSGSSIPSAISIEGHLRQIGDVVAAIRTGSPLAISGREGRKAVALVEALYTSAENGRPEMPV